MSQRTDTSKRHRSEVIAAGGNWRYLEADKPVGGGRYWVRLVMNGVAVYDVARWDGVHWDRLAEHITHWAPIYSPSGELQND